jgi:hypothetical protein
MPRFRCRPSALQRHPLVVPSVVLGLCFGPGFTLVGCGADESDGRAAGRSVGEPSTGSPVRPPAYHDYSPGPAPSGTAHITDPEAVTVAYIEAQQTVMAADATAPPRRAEAYMAPDNPERGLGQPVWDVPPEGTTRKPVRISTEVIRRDGYKAVVRVTYSLALTGAAGTGTGAGAGAGVSVKDEGITTYVVCEKQADETWLIVKETSSITP